VVHVIDFQQQSHGGCQRDAFVTGQGEHLVVVHDCVHGLNPLCRAAIGSADSNQHHALVDIGTCMLIPAHMLGTAVKAAVNGATRDGQLANVSRA
jgi:hypothetical protein